jgi:hypothetical protein
MRQDLDRMLQLKKSINQGESSHLGVFVSLTDDNWSSDVSHWAKVSLRLEQSENPPLTFSELPVDKSKPINWRHIGFVQQSAE